MTDPDYREYLLGESSSNPPELEILTFPTTFAQRRLWFLEQLGDLKAAYNIRQSLHFTGLLNRAALQKALTEIVQRHETLRTTFKLIDGEPWQVINPNSAVVMKLFNLEHLAESEKITVSQQLTTQEHAQPFKLETGPLLRTTLIRQSLESHWLLVTMHHIISDAWSMGILIKELNILYRAYAEEQTSNLPELAIQYGDFADWQQQSLREEILNSQLAYWKKQLAGIPPAINLPTDFIRPPTQTNNSGQKFLQLPAPLTEALKALSQKANVTLFMTLLAAFGMLLHRYSGQKDVVIGSPIAGRNRPELESLIGFFVNTLVLRLSFKDDLSFWDLLEQTREVSLGAYTNQELPFEKLVEVLRPERDLGRSPLFQVWFNMLNVARQPLELPGIETESIENSELAAKFDLNLYARDSKDGIKLHLVYNADLFKSERIAALLSQLQYLLAQIVEQPKQSISRYSLVSSEATKYLPNPRKPLKSQPPESILVKFKRQVQANPNAIAVVENNLNLTYENLDILSNQLANYLIEQGIQPQDKIAIYGDRHAALVVTLLGIWRAGAAFIILDPAYPGTRLAACLEIAQPQGWLSLTTTAEISADLEHCLQQLSLKCSLNLPPIVENSEADLWLHQSKQALSIEISEEALAYVAFTSGTTGIPKGILGTHAPLDHFLQWHTQTFELQASDRFCLLGGLGHDPLLRDIFTPLCLGAALYIPTQEVLEISSKLKSWLEQSQISVIHLTPALGKLLNISAVSGQTTPLNSLRYVFFGGDTLTYQDVSNLQQIAPQVSCINFYGTTETPQAVSYHLVSGTPNDLHNSPKAPHNLDLANYHQIKANLPLGVGIEDTQLLILNSAQQLAGVSEIGEISVRSPYLALGYLTPEESSRFSLNPFTQEPGDRIYLTGDLGRYLPDGQVEYLGRSDRQINLRGFRVELDEVETMISQHPGVKAAKVGVESKNEARSLIAFIVLDHKCPELNSQDLRTFLGQRLPKYMLPSRWLTVDTFPLTPNGKVDWHKLMLLKEKSPSDQAKKSKEFSTPQDELENRLADIWQKVLKLPKISINDDFFQLVGHSLKAVQIFAEIERIFGYKLPLATLFQATTIKELANLIRRKNWLDPWSSLVPIKAEGTKPPLFYLHAGGGNLLVYRELALSLGDEQPVYGLQPRGLDGKLQPSENIQEMAEFYISQIRQVQSQGPYYLAGLSTGGLIAWEIAQQLKQEGQIVNLLALFDTYGPGYPQLLSLGYRLGSVISWAFQDFCLRLVSKPQKIWLMVRYQGLRAAILAIIKKLQLTSPPPEKDFTYIENLVEEQINRKLAKYVNDELIYASQREKQINLIITNILRKSSHPYYANTFTNGLFKGLQNISQDITSVRTANFKARKSYRPEYYSGRVILFRASQRPPGIVRDPKLGWQDLAGGGIETYEIPGTHSSIVKSPKLAIILKRCLEKAQKSEVGLE